MSFGDPIEFVRNLLNGDRQRVGNRIKKEAFTVTEDPREQEHFVCATNGVAQIILAAPPAGHHWRFDYIHYSYSGAPALGSLQITDGTVTYHIDITAAGPGHLTFDTTRWTEGAAVTITLAAGGQGVDSCLNILGPRYERLYGDF